MKKQWFDQTILAKKELHVIASRQIAMRLQQIKFAVEEKIRLYNSGAKLP